MEGGVVRAMILAAGLGTRLRPLTSLRAKPALPVRGRPVISLLLELLARQGFREIMINLHHLPHTIRQAIALDHPTDVEVTWSEEAEPLGTGGALRQASEFLRGSPACLVLAGDMLLDVDLRGFSERHAESGRGATLLLRSDGRSEQFGTIGIDANRAVCRIGKQAVRPAALAADRDGDSAVETDQGLFTGVRCFSRDLLDHWPDRTIFEDLRDWLVPGIEMRGEHVGAEIVTEGESVWEPVGTPAEYLRVNLAPPDLPTLGGPVPSWTGDVEVRGRANDVVAARSARIPDDVQLERAIVWDGESLPAGFVGRDGVFAGGTFHACSTLEAGGNS